MVEKGSTVGATVSLLTTIVLPATVALVLYLILSYVVIPLWQRYRGRYSRYIPLDTINSHTSGLGQRIAGAFGRFFPGLVLFVLPSTWRSRFSRSGFTMSAQEGSDIGFDEEDGEELLDVDQHRREALSLDAGRGIHDGRRLSRDLEEGFADDSDDDRNS